MEGIPNHAIVSSALFCVQCESKKNPPLRGPDIFHFFTNG